MSRRNSNNAASRLQKRRHPSMQLETLENRLVLDSTVVFSEIMYNPPGDQDDTLEWIELQNQLAVDVDISEWVLDGGVRFTIPDQTIVPGRGQIVIAADPAALLAETGVTAIGPFVGRLNNAGDQLQLFNNDERLMNEVQFGDGGEWPVAADGSGATLAKAGAQTASHVAANWTFSPEQGGTPGESNFLEPGTLAFEELLPESTTARALVPFDLDGSLGQTWIDPAYDDASWTVGTTGVGFDNGRSPIYLDLLGLNLDSPPDGQTPIPMQRANASLYIRIPFEVSSDLSDVDQLLLRMKYDDGFVAYINGTEVAHANAPGRDGDNRPLAWLSTSTGSHSDNKAVNFESFRFDDFADALVQGENILAIHALNRSATDDDLLMIPQIVAGRVVEPKGIIPLALNEIAAGDADEFWVELSNDGDEPIDLDGFVLATTGDTGGQFTFTAQTLAPGELLMVNQQQLGFRPTDGDQVFVYSPNQEFVVDGRSVTGRLRGRSDRFGDQWLYPDTATPGAANQFAFHDDIVINEIMYHAPPAQLSTPVTLPTQERSDLLAMDASGWRYRQTAAPLPADWATVSHAADGTEWSAGQAPVGYDPSPPIDEVNTQLDFPALQTPPFITYYFETDFEFSGTDNPYGMELHHFINGGAVFYLNGEEFLQFNMPAGDFDAQTPADRVMRRGASVSDAIEIPAHLIVEGTNRLSVEVHRSGLIPSSTAAAAEPQMGAQIVLREQVDDGVPAQTFTESDEEWIELYNRGASPVDLGGWRLSEAVDYQFDAGTVIEPGQYLVVAGQADQLAAKYPDIAIVGSYDRTLSNHDDRIRLLDADKNPADEVHYFENGRWAATADGGGSSLELVNPDADNSKAEAWAGSDETSRSEWNTYSYRKVSLEDPQGRNAAYNEFIFGLLDSGEFLIDDVVVVQDPDGEAIQLIQNGTFEGDTLDGPADTWRIVGTHQGTVVADPGDPNNKVLHVEASGPHAYPHDHAETTFIDNTRTVNGALYEITFRAKWLAGGSQLNTRLFFSRAALTHNLAVPTSLGTPGAENSQFQANIGPTYGGFLHSPAVPVENQDVTVTVQADDADGVASVALRWKAEGADWNQVQMAAQDGGRYTATIPGQAGGARVQFYVEGLDAQGNVSTFPAAGADSRALYQVDDGFESNKPHPDPDTSRIIVLEEDHLELYPRATNHMSNNYAPGTFIHNNEVFYDIGVRQTGSRFIRPNSGIKVLLDPSQPFYGVHDSVRFKINLMYEIGMKQMINRSAGSKASMYDDIAFVIRPATSVGRVTTGMSMLQLARYEAVYLDEQFENGSEGTKFEVDDVTWGTVSGNVEGLKTGTGVNQNRDIGINADFVAEQGHDKEFYRGHVMIHNQRAKDDFDSIIQMGQAIHLTGDKLDAATQAAMDVDIWMRHFATQSFLGNWDTYGFRRPKNLRVYVRPDDGKVMPLAWDSDRGEFGGEPLYFRSESLSRLDEIRDIPSNKRLFWGHMLDLINRGFNEEYISYWTNHYNTLMGGQGGSAGGVSLPSMARQVGARVEEALAQMEIPGGNNGGIARVPFEITTNGGENMQADTAAVTLEGTGWIDVREIHLASTGQALDVTWTDEDSWEIRLPLVLGENEIALEAFDFQANSIATDTITVTTTIDNPVTGLLRVTEVNYHPYAPTTEELAQNSQLADNDFEFIEVQNVGNQSIDLLGVHFTDGIEFQFPETTLDAGQMGVIVRNADAFALRYGTDVNILGQFESGGLNNAGERLALVDGLDNTVMDLEYSDNDPWPQWADSIGGTLQLVDPANTTVEAHGKHYAWRGSTEFGGSPGNVGADRIGVVVNEVLTNAADNGADAIELFNSTARPIDVSGWYLSDSSNDLLKFQIPAGTTLGPFDYVVFDETQFNPTPDNPQPNHFGLSGTRGDDVWLAIPAQQGGVGSVVNEVHFGPAAIGESLGRPTATGEGRLAPMTAVTLAAPNAPARVGPVVISELQYDPGEPTAEALAAYAELTSGDLEFVEIRNTTSQSVDLTNWRIRGGADYDFDAAGTLGPGETLLVISFDPNSPDNAGRLAGLRTHYGVSQNIRIVGGFQGQLSGTGERLQLQRPGEASAEEPDLIPHLMEDEVFYDNLAPWPTQAAGQGSSLHRTSRANIQALGNDPASWFADAPSPGLSTFTFVLPGDSNQDGRFDQLDIVMVQQGGKYLTDQQATFAEGDWNGDGVFDELDIVTALQSGHYAPSPAPARVPAGDFDAALAQGAGEDAEADVVDWLFGQ